MMYPNLDPVAFSLGPLPIRWYGLMYLAGFASAWWLGRMRARRRGAAIAPAQMDDLLFYAALGVIVGGRLGYILFYDFAAWLEDPVKLLRLWEGGMSFHGGFLGVLVALYWYARRLGKGFFVLSDFVAPLVPLGLMAGRLGNFINGELWGGPSGLPWAMRIDCSSFPGVCWDSLQLPPTALVSPPLHPSQLYQAGLEGLLLFLVLWLFSRNPRPTMAVSGLFLIGYGLARFLVEFVRLPDAHLGYLAWGWLTMGQLLSVPMLLAGAVMMFLAYRQPRVV